MRARTCLFPRHPLTAAVAQQLICWGPNSWLCRPSDPLPMTSFPLVFRWLRSKEQPSSLRWMRMTWRVAGWGMEWRSSYQWRRGSATPPSESCTASQSRRRTGVTPASTPFWLERTGAPSTSMCNVSDAESSRDLQNFIAVSTLENSLLTLTSATVDAKQSLLSKCWKNQHKNT